MDVREVVIAELSRIEPRLLEFAQQAPSGSIEACEEVFASSSIIGMRSNAVLLACILDQERGLSLVRQAVFDPAPLVRIAAVRSLETVSFSQIRTGATDILKTALTDSDAGVKKYALKIFQSNQIDSLMPLVSAIANSDESGFLRVLAGSAVKR